MEKETTNLSGFFSTAICHQVLDIYGERESDEKKSESVKHALCVDVLDLRVKV